MSSRDDETIIGRLVSEQRNSRTMEIDRLPTIEILKLINEEDSTVPYLIREVLPAIEIAVETVVDCFRKGGRLIYVGAGTSGRLAITDASECRPTFGVPTEMVQGMIAGGDSAIRKAVEGAEDSQELGRADIRAKEASERDVIIGIASSGRTPYVIGALKEARERGARTIAIANNPNSEIGKVAEHRIEVVTGPEIILGSTRMKAGTSQKLVLNMITTASMIRIGKVYSNLMVDIVPSNSKLLDRSIRLIMQATSVSRETARRYFEESERNIKTAIVMIQAKVDRKTADDALGRARGHIATALVKLSSPDESDRSG